ncbi:MULTISPECIES: hypothetical protein [unclassified Tenacibaculum]|uniref:hypothetical protein n=1 Tax=unclassified Tenacibaculum TaxID=2635139 RepID=UPI001F41A517|nr:MULTISPECIES: hypothetical protein [unclassified Tenacibaculum]MCF2875402.1 hypothetical protein [Tenacibaculum sp. Cn5-1]MCF2935478.1 hypothetical protein [Tenacibaculum sp. Cn5-34]MCG7512038.1 hypothetical protein [Tenacibaculum sp. Cn5-46]
MTQTTTEKVKKQTTGILAVIILVIGIAATFLHRSFIPAEENPKIVKLYSERSQLKKYWNNEERKHDSLLKNNLISINDYLSIKEKNEKLRVQDFRKISKKRKLFANEFSFNGRNSFHYWLWAFGIFILMFIISIFSSLKDYRLKKAGLLKWYEPHASIVFIFISLFWLYHTIFKKNYDFSIDIYLGILVAILIPVSYFIYHFIRRIFTLEDKLLDNIRLAVSHILKYTKEDKEEEKWNTLEKVADNGR